MNLSTRRAKPFEEVTGNINSPVAETRKSGFRSTHEFGLAVNFIRPIPAELGSLRRKVDPR